MKCLNTGDGKGSMLYPGEGRLGAGWSPTCKYVRYLNSKIDDLLKTKQERKFSSEKSDFLTHSQLLPFDQASLAVMTLVSAGFGCLEKSTNGTGFKLFYKMETNILNFALVSICRTVTC